MSPYLLFYYIMPDSFAPYRLDLLQSKSYVPCPLFLQNVRWQYDDVGHVLVDTSSGSNMVAVVVARVLEHQLQCGPAGNYFESDSKLFTLATAKYLLQLGRPIGSVFAADYDKVLENIAKIQAQIASTQDRRNFLVADGGIRNLRFARNIFEKRVRITIIPSFLLIFSLQDRIITGPVVVYQQPSDLRNKGKQFFYISNVY